MPLAELLRVAFAAIAANKLRSLLTALGIIIGIAAVIAMVALGEGAQRTVESRLQGMGANVLTIRQGQSFFGGVARGSSRLSIEDAEKLSQESTALIGIAPEMEGHLQVESGRANANLSILGSWPDYFPMNNFALASGRLFTARDDEGRRRVAVLGALVGDSLGAPSTAALVGQTIRIRSVPFEVVGVLAEKGSQGFSSPDEAIYVPLTTARFRLFGDDRVRSIGVQVASQQAMDQAMEEIDRILRRAHKIRPGQAADFSIRDQAALLATVQETTKTFSFLLAGIAAISLLVGGIGIMNVLLAAVIERTREIGIRRAAGARRRDILAQFLAESLVITGAGSLFGLVLGIAGAFGVASVMRVRTSAPVHAAFTLLPITVAASSAVLIGLTFGLYPALKASRLSPIDAIRTE